MLGALTQTDFKAPDLQRIARFCHGLLLLSVTAKQRFKASATSDVTTMFNSSLAHVRCATSRWITGSRAFVELAIKR